MDIFISWSGDRSRKVAEIFRKYIPAVMQFAKPFLSQSDIDSGSRWNDALNTRLEAANFGIICVSPENKSSEWIHFEAGAVSKVISSSRVVPVLFDMGFDQLSYPLVQFQARTLSVASVETIFNDINEVSENPVAQETFNLIFEKFKPDIKKAIKDLPKAEPKPDERSKEEKMFSEILGILKRQDSKSRVIEQNLDSQVVKRIGIEKDYFNELLQNFPPDESNIQGLLRLLSRDARVKLMNAIDANDENQFMKLMLTSFRTI